MTLENKPLSTTSAKSACILVAETDNAMRSFLCNLLVKLGYRVRTISNELEVDEFLGSARKSPSSANGIGVDVIITAISLPGKTALDVLTDFKDSADQVPVILITAFTEPQTVEEAMRLGAAAVFDKPFDITEFTDFMATLVPRMSS